MDKVFFLNRIVGPLTGVRQNAGNLFGIELELEGRGVGLPDVATKGWLRHNDGSLRGESIEFTTNGGHTLDETMKLVNELFQKFKENGVKFNDSIRTSTHVHLNFSDKTIKQVLNFFMLFTVFEEVLQHYSGEDRKGNLFCISSREAEGIIHLLEGAVDAGNMRIFAGDKCKYSACNLSTLYKFGTLEIRTMRGATSAEQVNRWLSILNDLYVYSLNTLVSPVDVVVDLSQLGAEGLSKKIFTPDNYQELMRTFPQIQNLHYSLMEGVRLIQVFAYEVDADFRQPFDKTKAKALKVGAELPKIIADGPFHGLTCAIYRANARHWNLTGEFIEEPFWADGERVADAPRIFWDEVRHRFIEELPDGGLFACRWARHPWLRAERPVHVDGLDEVEAEPEVDDDDLEFEEEGDGF